MRWFIINRSHDNVHTERGVKGKLEGHFVKDHSLFEGVKCNMRKQEDREPVDVFVRLWSSPRLDDQRPHRHGYLQLQCSTIREAVADLTFEEVRSAGWEI